MKSRIKFFSVSLDAKKSERDNANGLKSGENHASSDKWRGHNRLKQFLEKMISTELLGLNFRPETRREIRTRIRDL